MKANLGASESVALRKKTERRIDLFLRSKLHVEKYRKGEDKPYEITEPVYNTLTSAGLSLFCDLVMGIDSAHYSYGNAELNVGRPTGTIPLQAAPDDATPGHAAPSAAIVMEFRDDTILEYTPATATLWNGPAAGGATQFNSIACSFGGKLQTENWHYFLTIELYSTSQGVASSGLAHMLKLFAGIWNYHFDDTHTKMQPYSDYPPTVAVGSPIAVSAFYHTPNSIMHWEFQSVAGSNTGEWRSAKVFENQGNGYIRSSGCRADGTTCGQKYAEDIWTYVYVFTLAQGS